MTVGYLLGHDPVFADDVDVLTNLSKYFDIKETIYGGRGCFANENIPQGTVIHECASPISSTIVRPFRKEVCSQCFQYFDGKTLKIKLGSCDKQYKDLFLYFCSDECKMKFEDDDIENLHLDSLLAVEKYYISGLKKKEVDYENPKGDLQAQVKTEWEKVKDWEEMMSKMKPSKKLNLVPRISDSEYMEIKYVIGVLFKFYKYNELVLEKATSIKALESTNLEASELILFQLLQSSEEQKVQKYPYLLYSYINIYKFIKITSHPLLQPFITCQNIRDIIGKNLSNAFGIWSIQIEDEDKEFFGFGVYPSASYFNHSCSPNLIKKRIDNKLTFTTTKEIASNDELCIDYGNYLNENVEKRKKELKEWFFDCGCEKCNLESTK